MFIAAHNGARIWGGAERATVALLAGLRDRGHRVVLYCNDPLVRDNADRRGVPALLRPLGGDVALHDAFALARTLRADRPDVLIVGTFKKLWLAALAARIAGVRVIARIGLETDVPRSAKYRFVLRHWVDAVVLNADRIRTAYLALPGWDERRVQVIYNGVRAPERHRAKGAVREELGVAPDVVLVGSVGRLAVQKRFDRLLDAVAALPRSVHLVVAGDGELRAELEARAAEAGLAGRVHLLGHREDVGDVLDALDVYVVASDREGMSNSMLEALAAGLPVVSTPVSGATPALEPSRDGSAPGWMVDFSSASLAEAIAHLAADAELRARMGAAARVRAAERFDFERMVDAWEGVLGAGGAPP